MNLLADESVDRQIVERLRAEGVSVLYAAEMQPGVRDEVVLAEANRTGGPLLTADIWPHILTFRELSVIMSVSWGRRAEGNMQGSEDVTPRLLPDETAIGNIAERFAPIFNRYRIQKAILFGSVARGEPSRRSDIDLILIQATTRRFLDRFDGILCDLNKASPGPSVDVLIYTPTEFEVLQNRNFVAKAVREGKVLYEQQ